MNTKRFFGLMLLLFTLGFTRQAVASHGMGADLSYECLGNDSFRITLNLYRDCDGIDAPTSASVNLSSVSCGVGSLNFTLPLASVATEVSALCPTSLPQSSCNGGALPGVEQYIYSDVIVIPSECPDWVISYSLCCRNAAINRITNPGGFDLYVQARLNNANGNCDDSPVFTSLPVPYVCAGQQFSYNHGAFDADGDSLVYSLVCPLDAPNTCVTYVSGYSPTQPLSTTGQFQFDATTGQMTFTPDIPQVGVVAILVEEYRNGVLIGSTMRDIQVVVINCTNNQPSVPGGIQNQVGGAQRDSVTAEVCPNEQITFQFNATDPDGANTLTVTSNIAQTIPGATLNVTGAGNNLVGNFSWIPTGADTGVNVFTVTITDGACPILGTSVISFQIYVLDGTTAGPDLSYCPSGGPVQLNALGGTNFVWSPQTGLSDPNIRNPLASPTVTTDYVVTSDLSGQCKNIDTVRVYRVPDFNLMLTPPTDTICRHGSTVLNAIAEAQYAPYTYQWEPNEFLIGSTTASPTAIPYSTTTYTVRVTSDTGCTRTDSVEVVVIGIGPVVEITADRNNVCPGDTIQLTGKIYPLECGESFSGCSAQNLPVPRTYGTGTATTFSGTPFGGSSEDVRWQALYLASDLLAAGFGPGTITRIELEVGSKASTGVFQNLTLKMGCTDNNSLSTDQWQPANTVVFGPSVYSTSLGINSFPLSIPFDWDGRTNLVLEICFNNPSLGSAGGNDQLMSVSRTYTASMRNTGNNTDGCSLNPAFAYTQIPRTVFHICDPLVSDYTLSWTPSTGLSSDTILNPRAVVNGVQLYTLNVRDSLCEGSGYIIVNIDTTYGIDAGPDTTLCGTASIQLGVDVVGTPPTATLPCGTNTRPCSNPSTVTQIGMGVTSTGTGTPYEGFWEDGRTQFLYRASELQAQGLTASGTISAIAFNVTTKASSLPYKEFTIKMACTGLNTLPATSFTNAAFTTVYGPVDYNTVASWNTHTFTTPYDWDGVSNIIVEVCFNNGTNEFSDDDLVAYTPTTGNTSTYDFTDGVIGCTMNTPAGTVNRPNARFTYCKGPTGITAIRWTPGASLSDSTSATPIASPTVNTTYRVEYTFVDGCVRVDSITVGVTSFNTTISPDVSICGGDNTQLLVTGGTDYQWDTLPGLSCFICPNPIATPDTTTTYYVNITDPSGTCIKRDSVTVTVFPAPQISFGNDSLYCFIGSRVLDAGPGFADYDWSTSESTRTITVTAAGLYAVTVTDSNGCVAADSIQLSVNPPPTVNLGPDAGDCAGDSVTLDAGAGFVTYAWNTNNATTQTITVFTSGVYAVTVTDGNGCPGIDTALITLSSPDVDLGSDATLCANVSLILNAGGPENTYLWDDSSTAATRVVTQGGAYSVTATDVNGCTDADTVTLNFYPDNSVDLGPDTVTCNNRSITFNAGPGYTAYVWSTTSNAQAITTTQGGEYSVTVTDVNGCQYRDTVLLSDLTPAIELGADRLVCQGDTVVFDAGPGFDDYDWSNSATTQSITVSAPAVYSVTVTDANTCTATDNARLTVNNLPQPNLGANDSVCPGHILYPGAFETYEWSDFSTDSILIVNFTDEYCVTVSDANGCVNSSCVDLLVYEINLFVNDVLLCDEGDSATLSAPQGLVSYNWSTSETTPDIIVTSPGTYTVTVTNAQGCIAIDQGVVSYDSMSVVINPDTVVVTSGGSDTLNAVIISGSGAYTISWTPVDGLSDPTSLTPIVTPTGSQVYTVEVTDQETNCTSFATVLVIAEAKLVFPDAFNPNGSFNPTFKPVQTAGMTVKEFRIYNRWGQVVGENLDPTVGWDGTFDGKEQPIGTYSYYFVAQLANGETKTQSGVFSLLR